MSTSTVPSTTKQTYFPYPYKYKKVPNPDLEDRVKNEKWPDRNPNWPTLTSGQKWARIKSYNSARRSRGKPPIPNPYNKDKEGKHVGEEFKNPDGSLSLTPKPPTFVNTVNKSIRNNPFFKQLLDTGYTTTTIQPVIQRYASELDDMIANAPAIDWDNLQGEELDYINDSELMDVMDKIDSTTPLSISGGNKRKEIGDGTQSVPGNEHKLQKVGDRTTTSTTTYSPHNDALDEEMPNALPGTGDNMDTDFGVQGASSGGPASSGKYAPAGLAHAVAEDNIYVDRPISVKGGYMIRFGKVHRMLTYGFSSEILELRPQAGTTPNVVPALMAVSSSLATIPWDRAFYYLNPGEQASLPDGSKAHACHIRIVQRNPRVAFETNSSDTSLATLNQNKFGIKAVGLNTKEDIRMCNVTLTAGDSPDNMKPSALALPTSAQMNTIDIGMYGVSQVANSETGFNTVVPCQPFMIPMHYNKYAAFVNVGQWPGASGPAQQYVGWYDVSKHIAQYDMGAMIGKDIVNESYTFKDAPLKAQIPYVEYMLGSLGGVNYANCVFNDHNIGKEFNKTSITSIDNYPDSNPSETQTALSTTKDNYDSRVTVTNFRTNIPLEKVQFTKNIDSNRDTSCYVQPSIHVGISPVPRLSPQGDTTLLKPDSWTDVQAYYEITATLEVFIPYEHSCTHFGQWHKGISDVDMATAETTVPDIPIRMGHYPTTTAATLLKRK